MGPKTPVLNMGADFFLSKKALWTWKIFLHLSSVDVIAVFRKFPCREWNLKLLI